METRSNYPVFCDIARSGYLGDNIGQQTMRGGLGIHVIHQLKVRVQEGGILKETEKTEVPSVATPTNIRMTVEAFRGVEQCGVSDDVDEVTEGLIPTHLRCLFCVM